MRIELGRQPTPHDLALLNQVMRLCNGEDTETVMTALCLAVALTARLAGAAEPKDLCRDMGRAAARYYDSVGTEELPPEDYNGPAMHEIEEEKPN